MPLASSTTTSTVHLFSSSRTQSTAARAPNAGSNRYSVRDVSTRAASSESMVAAPAPESCTIGARGHRCTSRRIHANRSEVAIARRSVSADAVSCATPRAAAALTANESPPLSLARRAAANPGSMPNRESRAQRPRPGAMRRQTAS